MEKIRVEYLLPNITSERKLKWLENAKLIRKARDCEIVNWNFSEYLYRLHRENYKFTTGSFNKDITDEVNQRDYENWKVGNYFNIYQLNENSIIWDKTVIDALGHYLINSPLALPQFLLENVVDIIGLFLGQRILYSSVGLDSQFRKGPYQLISASKISKEEYAQMNIEAKYRFTLFANVIKQLLDAEINLEEFIFVNVRAAQTYQELGMMSLWNKKIKMSDYTRLDGISFSKEEVTNYFSFTTLTEFLDAIESLTETEYYIDFNEESMMLDPEKIKEFPKYPISDISYFGEENLISVKTVCETLKEQLNKVKKESEEKVLKRKLSTLRSKVAKSEKTIDYSAVQLEMDMLFEEITTSAILNKEIYLRELKNMLKQLGIQQTLDGQKELEINQKERTAQKGIEEQVQELNHRMNTLENRVNNLEKSLFEYIEHGGENPLKGEVSLSKEEIIKLISEYHPTTKRANMRKKRLLTSLKIATLGTMIGGMLFLNTSSSTPIPVVEEQIFPQQEENQQEIPSTVVPEKEEEIEKELLVTIPESVTVINNNLKPVEEIVLEVIRGKWGNEPDRSLKLTQAGYDYIIIQGFVNQVLIDNIPITELRTIGEIAVEVMQGKWGEGEEQKRRLEKVGFDSLLIESFIKETEPENFDVIRSKQYTKVS